MSNSRLHFPLLCPLRLPKSPFVRYVRLRIMFSRTRHCVLARSDKQDGSGTSERDDSKEQPSNTDGNKDVQDALEWMLRTEMEKQEIRDMVLGEAEQRKQTFRDIGEELKEELDRKLEIEKARTELSSRSILDDTFSKLDELDEIVAKVKQDLKTDQAELEEWEQQANMNRSKGLFFQSLYKTDKKAPAGSGLDPETTARLRAEVTEPLEKEVNSTFRRTLFTTMATLLLFLALQDGFSSTPHWGLDAVYVLIAAVVSFSAWSETQWTPWK